MPCIHQRQNHVNVMDRTGGIIQVRSLPCAMPSCGDGAPGLFVVLVDPDRDVRYDRKQQPDGSWIWEGTTYGTASP